MKITKGKLRQIIREELNEYTFGGGSMGGHASSNVRGSTYGSKTSSERPDADELMDVADAIIKMTREQLGNRFEDLGTAVLAAHLDDNAENTALPRGITVDQVVAAALDMLNNDEVD